MPNKANKNNKNAVVPTLAEYIAQQIAAKRAAALDKSRNRTSVKVPMVPNPMSEEDWKHMIDNNIKMKEESLSRIMNELNGSNIPYDINIMDNAQKKLDKLLEEKDGGYPKLVLGSNCMYNAGDCYDLNIPGNQTFAAKHKEKGFKRVDSSNMEPGDIVQDNRTGTPIHAMIYDSKDTEGNLRFNYARGLIGDNAFDINENYVKQGKYILPLDDYATYRYVGTPADSTQWINEYKQQYGNGMRCGGRRKAKLGLDIREGGIAIPIAPNMYYMNGRSHDEGGIAIGPNNKNGLEVEGGEVVKVGKNDVKVFSSVPLLRGASPAELVMGGVNPNKVFKAQEDFKDRNRINDDGTTYEMGGDKIYTPSKDIQRQIQETGRITIGGSPTVGGIRTFGYLRALANARQYGNTATNIFRAGKELIKRGTDKLVKDGKITRNVAQVPRSIYAQFVGGYGQNLPKTVNLLIDAEQKKKAGGIYIKPSKRGTFTAAATKHGMSVQEFASKVLANKEDYSPAMVKKANFARNASRWKKEYGGEGNVLSEIVVTPTGNYDKIYDATGINKRKKIAKDILQILPFSGFVSDVIDAIIPNGISEPLSTGGAVSSASAYGLAKAKVPFYSIPSLAFKTALGLPDMANDIYTIYNDIKTPKEEFNRNKKEYGGSMLYTINGNVKNGLSLRPKAELGKEKKYKHNKIDGYGDSVEIDGKFYRYDSDSGLYLLEDKETVNTNLSKTVYGASSVRHIAYDRQGNRYQRRSDGTLIRVSPKKDDYATSKELEEVVITPEKPKKVENVSITGEKVENGVKKTSTPSIEGKTSVSDYRTGPNAHTIPDFVGKEPVKVEEAKPVTTNKVTVNNKKVTTTKPAPASTVEQPAVVRRDEYYSSPRVEGPATPVDETYAARQARGTEAVKEALTYPKGAKTNEIDEPLIGKFKPFTLTDAISGLGNMVGSTASYFINRNLIDKYPMPTKPIMTPVVKLKTSFDVSGDIADIEESRRIAADAYKRNTSSSAAYLSRLQSGLNTAYRQKAEARRYGERMTNQLINADLQNRQNIYARNAAIQNDYYNRLVGSRQAKSQLEMQNLNHLIGGLTGGVTNIMSNIGTRANYNKMAQAIQAANPNVDPRLLGIYDYYEGKNTGKKYNKRGQLIN